MSTGNPCSRQLATISATRVCRTTGSGISSAILSRLGWLSTARVIPLEEDVWSREVITLCATTPFGRRHRNADVGFRFAKLSGTDIEDSSYAGGTPTRCRAKVRAPSATTAHRQN